MLVPRFCLAAMAATAIRAAIRPYSMAVAARRLRTSVRMKTVKPGLLMVCRVQGTPAGKPRSRIPQLAES